MLTIGISEVQVPAEGLTIMCISTDRNRIVRWPLDKEDRSCAWRKIALIWICSLLVTIPAGYMSIVYDPDRIGSQFKCNWVWFWKKLKNSLEVILIALDVQFI